MHVLNLTERNSSHLVVGHRSSKAFTVEGKNTLNSNSRVDDEGSNAAPAGRADIRIVDNAAGELIAYWQLANLSGGADNWRLYKGDGSLPGSPPAYGASATVYVGLITYAQDSRNIPFVGTCDSFEVVQQ